MNNLSLKKKLVLQVVGICLALSFISGLILYRNAESSKLYQSIAVDNLPKVELLGKLMAEFRMTRIQIRSLGLVGNTSEDNSKFADNTKKAVSQVLEIKKAFSLLKLSDEEKLLFKNFEESWGEFQTFGGELLSLYEKGDVESRNKMTELVREVCPVKSNVVTAHLLKLIEYQSTQSKVMTQEALETEKNTTTFALLSIIVGFSLSLVIGYYFANSISNSLVENIRILNEGAAEIDEKSVQVAEVSTRISEASTQQAASLQETVASIDEISAMIANNADSAASSSKSAQQSTLAAQKGKEKAELMLQSINDISRGNDEIIAQMEKSNQEISEIVKVIEEISSKTQVINDIVFQTKLLSFNASVEAARAGEHGKGFAVVAEEVGNLASMSGNAATEITNMLLLSTKKVTEIVDGTRSLMNNLIKQSKEKVDFGTRTAKDCAQSLDEILVNVSSVNEMIREISTASQEQSTGVREVNTTMSELDHLTQANSSIAQESSHTASILKEEAEKLQSLVSTLTELVEGKSAKPEKRKTSRKQATGDFEDAPEAA